ncbi:MAG: membrane protein insertase YidC [Rickettsiales bacterium]|nr:membrane protein insertase YidC [Rickettsiales bacterium]OUT43498.1 MAG: membrane protein insertase YidC [Pelagibacteraceae bacterium TMED13]|tara:strand:+ start:313 stop:2028 length:1716 start_codon:yes stop_codon:yes gene_type:complete
MDNQKNLLIAVVLSVVILVGFDFFFKPEKKQLQESSVEQNQIDQNVDSDKDENIPSINSQIENVQVDKNKILEERISFNSKRLSGTINLIGATLDDLSLKDYFESISKEKKINILNPVSSVSPYFLRIGWASPDKSVKLPNKNSKWKSVKKNYNENEKIQLEWNNNEGLTFYRTIEFDENFMISVIDKVQNKSPKTIKLTNFSYLRRLNYRPENKFFILHEGPLGVFNDTLKEVSYDEIEENNEIIETTKNGWIGYTDHYWQVTIFPETNETFKARFKNLKDRKNSIQIDFINENIKTLKSGDSLKTKSYIFAGAKEVPLIDQYIKKIGINKLDLSVDFGWFYFLTKPLFYALHFLSSLVGNFGVGIIILTICIRIVLFPLANKSFKSMNSMRMITPEIQRIRERYKDDRQRMNQEMFAMYKEKKINPAAGCLPILIQIPIFFALYKVLFVSIEMRHAPFFGWIKDLSAPDPTSLFNLFGLVPWDTPAFLTIGIWPILMGITMFLQQKINPPPPDPIQAKIFMMLPFIFTFLLATFPSGMVVYWTINNILSIAQQYILLRKQSKMNITSRS